MHRHRRIHSAPNASERAAVERFVRALRAEAARSKYLDIAYAATACRLPAEHDVIKRFKLGSSLLAELSNPRSEAA